MRLCVWFNDANGFEVPEIFAVRGSELEVERRVLWRKIWGFGW